MVRGGRGASLPGALCGCTAWCGRSDPSSPAKVERVKAIRRFTVRPVLPEPLMPLAELARNLRWSWHTETRELFQSVDPEGWQAMRR